MFSKAINNNENNDTYTESNKNNGVVPARFSNADINTQSKKFKSSNL